MTKQLEITLELTCKKKHSVEPIYSEITKWYMSLYIILTILYMSLYTDITILYMSLYTKT